jgi:hypothetical protein
LCTLQRRILFCIERNTSDISEVSTGSLFEYWEIENRIESSFEESEPFQRSFP